MWPTRQSLATPGCEERSAALHLSQKKAPLRAPQVLNDAALERAEAGDDPREKGESVFSMQELDCEGRCLECNRLCLDEL